MNKKVKLEVTIEYIEDDAWNITCSAQDHNGNIVSATQNGFQLGFDFSRAYHAMTAKIAANNQEEFNKVSAG